MKKFLRNSALFVFLCIVIPYSTLLFLPPTPRAKSSFLFSKLDKDALLKNTPSPRIILIGGSNLSFGLDSKKIKDSFGINPINTGVTASLGLIYMMDNTLPYIRPGDHVVIVPEYSQYYSESAYGNEPLLRTVLDVSSLNDVVKLRRKQVQNIAMYTLKYMFSKVKRSEYFNLQEDTFYSRSSFNEYGDVNKHWDQPHVKVEPNKTISGEINEEVIAELMSYQQRLSKIGAAMYISFPGYQSSSFNKSKRQIVNVEKTLRSKGFNILGSSARYIIADTLVFNTPYHLTKKGLDSRTALLIEDLKNSPGFYQPSGNEAVPPTTILSDEGKIAVTGD